MVNLDVPPDFTAAVAGALRPDRSVHGRVSRPACSNTDINNVAPRIGVAWRIKPGTILRGGYGISFNSGSYSTIARQLAAQPPFSTSGHRARHGLVPLLLDRSVRARRHRA